MVAGRETLNILQEEHLASRGKQLEGQLLDGLQKIAKKHPIIQNIRGKGLLYGVEFQPAAGLLPAMVPRWARQQIFAQVVSAILLRDFGLLTQTCGLAQTVLRIEPPLVISLEEISFFIDSLDKVLTDYPTYNSASMAAFRKTILGREL